MVTRAILLRHGMMRREDAFGSDTTPSIEQIANCEMKTGFLIDLKARQYRNYKVVKFASEAQRDEYLRKTGKTPIAVESKTVDTGERKVFFGYSARHLITTTKLLNSSHQGDEETIDGWYIEHETLDRNCAPDFVRYEPFYVVGTALVAYPDMAQFQHTGPLPTGLAISLKMTGKRAALKDGSPARTITIEKTVEELSDSPLDPSLFDLPGGFDENPQLLRGSTVSDR